ncbi:fungal-specific transcription factor domain-containing protein [Fusarium avenaceum]|nr:fungal-specific transcription factor domain-containing protein [Fusarium avenaceum]
MGSRRTSPKGCHNCRHSRIRCDESRPACRRCTSTGKQCLGYGTLWRWTDSIASRGKLAGKKLPLSEEHSGPSQISHIKADATRSAVLAANQRMNFTPFQSSTAFEIGVLNVGSSLIDPFFTNMSLKDRYYLSYFAEGLCPQLVAIDLPGHNPFPRLLPMGACSPVLQYTMVTAAALHMSNVLRPSSDHNPQDINGSYWDPSRRAMVDALEAKQRALYLLRIAFQNLEAEDRDMVLTAAMLLVTADMIDSGKHGSKAHLDGIGWLLSHAQPATTVGEMLKDFVISDCYIFYVFALTFMDPIPKSSIALNSTLASSAIHYAARNSFICCPAEILQILWSTAMILQEPTKDDNETIKTNKGVKLIMETMAFDVEMWSHDIQHVPKGRQVTDIQSRIHTGYTHQTACCLYIMYAIPSVRGFLPENTEQELEQGLLFHLRAINDEDPNFITSFWPTFVAGAQTRDREQQAWIIERMKRQSQLFPWGFLYTAIDTLRIIWQQRNSGQSELSWLEILRNPEVTFLIV